MSPHDGQRDEPRGAALLDHLAASSPASLVHVHHEPAVPGAVGSWPEGTHPDLVEALQRRGIEEPWLHQVQAAEAAMAGHDVVIATGTASGKSLAYWIPTLTSVLATAEDGPSPATVLHLSPTKALAADQFRALDELQLTRLRPAVVDGDTPQEERAWARRHARYVLTNPDMLHHAILPGHARWSRLLRGLRFIVIDEVHAYRGIFGAHVALVLRRLERLCATHGAHPAVIAASATIADPGDAAAALIGRPVVAVRTSTAPAPGRAVALWQPPPLDAGAETVAGADDGDVVASDSAEPARRVSTTTEAGRLLAACVDAGAGTLAFVRSRRGAEVVADVARSRLTEGSYGASYVAAYRGGYLPEERRALERDLRSGDLKGLATTNALELGIDVSGLDAVIVAGWPGTRSSFVQQIGRAGRAASPGAAVFVARDEPLDQYLVTHPDAVFGPITERPVFDAGNPFVLGPHLCAAAAEAPLTDDGETGLDRFGPEARAVVGELVADGLLRRRRDGWYWASRTRATDLADLRGGGAPVRIAETGTGRLLGTVDAGAADRTVHDGAVYLHQGVEHLVDRYDPDEAIAFVHRAVSDCTTHARTSTSITIVERRRVAHWGAVEVSEGLVDATTQVVGFVRRRKGTGQPMGEVALDLPARTLRTAAMWWTVPDDAVAEALPVAARPGAAHAAEHAAIGLLPLYATCDRWDLGGLSTVQHPDTGRLTVFVHDAAPGGTGFAARGFDQAAAWWSATRQLIADCSCADGCPACIQSPKCGNGNEPLHKAGAVTLLDVLLRDAPREALSLRAD